MSLDDALAAAAAADRAAVAAAERKAAQARDESRAALAFQEACVDAAERLTRAGVPTRVLLVRTKVTQYLKHGRDRFASTPRRGWPVSDQFLLDDGVFVDVSKEVRGRYTGYEPQHSKPRDSAARRQGVRKGETFWVTEGTSDGALRPYFSEKLEGPEWHADDLDMRPAVEVLGLAVYDLLKETSGTAP